MVGALRDRGLHAHWLSWDAPDVDRADLVILRATHDYAGRLDEFLAWTTRAANLLNPPAAVAWNADQRYLGDLAQRGVPTVPGEVFAPGDRVRLPRGGHAFVSPTIGTGGRRCDDRSTALACVAELHAAGRSAFVQPASERENVLIFLGGRPSHAFPLRRARFRGLGRGLGRAGRGRGTAGHRRGRAALRAGPTSSVIPAGCWNFS